VPRLAVGQGLARKVAGVGGGSSAIGRDSGAAGEARSADLHGAQSDAQPLRRRGEGDEDGGLGHRLLRGLLARLLGHLHAAGLLPGPAAPLHPPHPVLSVLLARLRQQRPQPDHLRRLQPPVPQRVQVPVLQRFSVVNSTPCVSRRILDCRAGSSRYVSSAAASQWDAVSNRVNFTSRHDTSR